MFQFNWDTKKHKWLKEHRGIGFEEIVFLITNGNLLDVVSNKSRNFPDQKMFVIEFNHYIYLVPFVKKGNEYFLKTIIPSRKATKKIFEMNKEKDKKLEKEETEILNSYENEEWESVPNIEEEIAFYSEVAKNTLKKDKRINIRVSNRDLLEIKKKAVLEGIPYQTLVSSILHKYINGRFIEKAS